MSDATDSNHIDLEVEVGQSQPVRENHTTAIYTADELNDRIIDQSIDTNRLAATLHHTMHTVAAIANWVNGQIQATGTGVGSTSPSKKK